MSQSFEKLKKQFDSQLDLTLRLVRVHGTCSEKMMAAHFGMLQAFLQKVSAHDGYASGLSLSSVTEPGNALTSYWKTCLHHGLDYQQQVLAELSRK